MENRVRRDCSEVIKQMLNHIPMSENRLREDLEEDLKQVICIPPEETIQWAIVSETLQEHINDPIKNWEFEVCSIFSTVPVEKLREIIATPPERRK